MPPVIGAGFLGIEHFTPPWDVFFLPLFNLLVFLYRIPFFDFALPYDGGPEIVPAGRHDAVRIRGRVLDGAGAKDWFLDGLLNDAITGRQSGESVN